MTTGPEEWLRRELEDIKDRLRAKNTPNIFKKYEWEVLPVSEFGDDEDEQSGSETRFIVYRRVSGSTEVYLDDSSSTGVTFLIFIYSPEYHEAVTAEAEIIAALRQTACLIDEIPGQDEVDYDFNLRLRQITVTLLLPEKQPE